MVAAQIGRVAGSSLGIVAARIGRRTSDWLKILSPLSLLRSVTITMQPEPAIQDSAPKVRTAGVDGTAGFVGLDAPWACAQLAVNAIVAPANATNGGDGVSGTDGSAGQAGGDGNDGMNGSQA